METEHITIGEVEVTLHKGRIIAHFIQGMDRKNIADVFGVSESCIDGHCTDLFKAFRVPNMVRLATYAVKNGYDDNGLFDGRDLMVGFERPKPKPKKK